MKCALNLLPVKEKFSLSDNNNRGKFSKKSNGRNQTLDAFILKTPNRNRNNKRKRSTESISMSDNKKDTTMSFSASLTEMIEEDITATTKKLVEDEISNKFESKRQSLGSILMNKENVLALIETMTF